MSDKEVKGETGNKLSLALDIPLNGILLCLSTGVTFLCSCGRQAVRAGLR